MRKSKCIQGNETLLKYCQVIYYIISFFNSGQFNTEQCSVTIPATEERDFGQWICKIYHGLSGEVEEGKTQLGMINMPEGVVLIVEETNNTEEGLHKSR